MTATAAVVADVSTPDGATGFVRGRRQPLGTDPDILVTNAGGPPPGTFSSTPFDAYEPALALNLLSVVAMCQAAVPPCGPRGGAGWSPSRRWPSRSRSPRSS